MADWPKTGDSLFAAGPWKAEALPSAYIGSGFYHFACGYKSAADELVAGVLSSRLTADSVVYPIFFLYRHYAELILKEIVEVGSKLEKQVTDPEGTHRIKQLWAKARPLLEQHCSNAEKADTDAVEQCMLDLDSIDQSGEAARYGTKLKKGAHPTWPPHLQINLGNMKDVMDRLGCFLERSVEEMDGLLRCQHDLEADLNSELCE